MLRESSTAFGHTVNVQAVVDPAIDPGIPHGSLLLAFSDAVVSKRETERLRAEIVAVLGPGGLVDAAGVAGNFAMMNRIADSVGMPMGNAALARTTDTRRLLDLDRFRHG